MANTKVAAMKASPQVVGVPGLRLMPTRNTIPTIMASTTSDAMNAVTSVLAPWEPLGPSCRPRGPPSLRGMTEVPEHLLRRSRERREALGLAGPGGGESGGAAESGGASAPAPAAIPADTGDGGDVVEQPAAAAAPAVVEPEPELVPAGPPPPDPGRSKNPLWVMPVLVGFPFWLMFYIGALSPPKATGPVDPLVLGA